MPSKLTFSALNAMSKNELQQLPADQINKFDRKKFQVYITKAFEPKMLMNGSFAMLNNTVKILENLPDSADKVLTQKEINKILPKDDDVVIPTLFKLAVKVTEKSLLTTCREKFAPNIACTKMTKEYMKDFKSFPAWNALDQAATENNNLEEFGKALGEWIGSIKALQLILGNIQNISSIPPSSFYI